MTQTVRVKNALVTNPPSGNQENVIAWNVIVKNVTKTKKWRSGMHNLERVI
jgi:hypothetical protein